MINLLGLAVGTASSVFILQFIIFELSYDNHHQHRKDIYRIYNFTPADEGGTIKHIRSSAPIGPALAQESPGVVDFVRMSTWGEGVVRWKNVGFKVGEATAVYVADQSLFEVFTYHFIRGDKKHALTDRGTTVLTESLAKKLFGDADPVGSVISYQIRQKEYYKVTAVIQDPPHNSNLKFDMLLSIHNELPGKDDNGWTKREMFETFVLLDKQADWQKTEKEMNALYRKNVGENTTRQFGLQALTDVHLHSSDLWEPGIKAGTRGDLKTVYFLVVIAILILVVTWVNYINITTVKSIDRNKEVGFKKAVGATKGALIRQFTFESALFNLAGLVLAVILVGVFFPFIKHLFNIDFGFFALFGEFTFWLLLLAILVVGVLLSGVYPAYNISSTQALTALKGEVIKSAKGTRLTLRKVLVVFQYTICIILIAGTITVYKQIQFMNDVNLGINIRNVILVPNPTFLQEEENIIQAGSQFTRELKKYAGIKSTTLSNYPGEGYFASSYGRRRNSSERHEVNIAYVDSSFLNAYEITLLAGRNLSEQVGADKKDAVLINESAVNLFGFESPEEAVNQQLLFGRWGERTIVGVIKDYHQEYVKKPIKPACFLISPYSTHLFYAVKLNAGVTEAKMAFIGQEFKRNFPDYPFSYSLLEEYYAKQYAMDVRFGKMCAALSALAVFLACLGLLALSFYTIKQRHKEIGIRKVLGATTSQILTLLSKEYFALVMVAFIIAYPIAYFSLHNWLEAFAYRVNVSWWFLMVPLSIVLPLVLLTVGYYILKAAAYNPTKILRSE
ncbi:MAG: ABC transporter permease [Cytophagales bacterium]|nr:ABC transporter permease [Cytophagales bacterium]